MSIAVEMLTDPLLILLDEVCLSLLLTIIYILHITRSFFFTHD